MRIHNTLLVLLVLGIFLVSSCAQYGQKTTQATAPAPAQPPQTQIQQKPQPATPAAPTEPVVPTTSVKEFSITADDSSYSPSGSINVNKGDKAKITFNVKTSNVRFGGLDFRSSEFDTGTIKPGNSKVVEFVVDKSFSISTYWPGSNTKKPYTINVVVQ